MDEKMINVSISLPEAQQIGQVLEGFLGQIYAAIEAAGATGPAAGPQMAQGVPAGPQGQRPPTPEEAQILDQLANQGQ